MPRILSEKMSPMKGQGRNFIREGLPEEVFGKAMRL
jgi:hypothetical protein